MGFPHFFFSNFEHATMSLLKKENYKRRVPGAKAIFLVLYKKSRAA